MRANHCAPFPCGHTTTEQAAAHALELLDHRPLVVEQREARQGVVAARSVQQLVYDLGS